MKLARDLREQMKKYPDFYQSVWKACARIPRGQTRTYGWLARAIGRPGAARAVGRALAANPFAPRIPCHRVLGAGGQMTGYSGRGGIRTKRSLLRTEGWENQRPVFHHRRREIKP